MDEFRRSLSEKFPVLEKYCTPDSSLPREAKNAVTWLDATAAASLSSGRFRRYMEVWQILCSDVLDEDFIGTFEQELRLSTQITACDVYIAVVMHEEDPSLVHKTFRVAGLLPRNYSDWIERRKTGQLPKRERTPSPPPFEIGVPRLSEVSCSRGIEVLKPVPLVSPPSSSESSQKDIGAASHHPSTCWTGRKSSSSSSSSDGAPPLGKQPKGKRVQPTSGKSAKSQGMKSSSLPAGKTRSVPHSKQLTTAGRGAFNASPGDIARTISWLCPFRVAARTDEPADCWYSVQRVKEWKFFPPIVLMSEQTHHDISAKEHFSFDLVID